MLKQETTAEIVKERSHGCSSADVPSPKCLVPKLTDFRSSQSERNSGCFDERISDVNAQLVDSKNGQAGNNRTNSEPTVVWLFFHEMAPQQTV